MSPTFSVIIPLYNKERIIELSVKSVLNQSFKDFELIIVDDGSTDNSLNVVKAINDDRIRIIEQENGGPSKARNTGAKFANGKWIVFLDADDELTDTALELFSNLACAHPDADIINCSSLIRYSDRVHLQTQNEDGCCTNNFKYWFYGGLMPGTGHSAFRHSIVSKYNYNENIRRYEDAELLFRMLKKARIYNCKEPSFYVNTLFSSASHARKDVSEDFFGHLDFKGKSFWEHMCLYRFYIEEKDNYKHDANRLYQSLCYRYDLLFLYKLLNWLK